jgi:hypothetical protein
MNFDEAPVYFVLRADEGGKEQGPMSVREIRARVSSGILKRTDWYARSGMAEWKLIFELLEAAQQVQTPPPVLPQPDAPPMIPPVRNPWGEYTRKQPNWGKRFIALGCIVAGLVMVVVMLVFMSDGPFNEWWIESEASRNAQNCILAAYPGAEKMNQVGDVSRSNFGNTYDIRFVVDGKNAFGGPVRKLITVTMELNGRSWSLKELKQD